MSFKATQGWLVRLLANDLAVKCYGSRASDAINSSVGVFLGERQVSSSHPSWGLQISSTLHNVDYRRFK